VYPLWTHVPGTTIVKARTGNGHDKEAAVVKQAIKECTLSVMAIAAELGISLSLLKKYRSGERAFPPEFRKHLAAVLAKHEATVSGWVRQLRGD
jgi:hypothetical protein